jgi:hypothetical protein
MAMPRARSLPTDLIDQLFITWHRTTISLRALVDTLSGNGGVFEA